MGLDEPGGTKFLNCQFSPKDIESSSHLNELL